MFSSIINPIFLIYLRRLHYLIPTFVKINDSTYCIVEEDIIVHLLITNNYIFVTCNKNHDCTYRYNALHFLKAVGKMLNIIYEESNSLTLKSIYKKYASIFSDESDIVEDAYEYVSDILKENII